MSDPRNFLSPQQEIDTKNTVSDSVVAGEPIETVSSIWGRVSAAMKQDLGDTNGRLGLKISRLLHYLKRALFFRREIRLFVTACSHNMQKNCALC